MRRALLLLSFILGAAALAQDIPTDVCTEEVPADKYGVPLCEDYELDQAIISGAKGGDPSALALAEERYVVADTYISRQRLAEVLLRRVANDSEIWSEIFADAQLAVRFADLAEGEPPEEFTKWCERRGLDPFWYGFVIDRAFAIASDDPRAHALVVQALESTERRIALNAAYTLIHNNEVDQLDAIERAMARFGSYSWGIAVSMKESMPDPRAQQIATRYIEATQP